MNFSIVILAVIASSCYGQRPGWGGNTGSESSLYTECMADTYQQCTQFHKGNLDALQQVCEPYADQCQRASQGLDEWPYRFRCESSAADCRVDIPRPPSGDIMPKVISPPGANMTTNEICMRRTYNPCSICYDADIEVKMDRCWDFYITCNQVSLGQAPMPPPFTCPL
ncbi:hypothetical protein MP228_006943 [Amoeboaphelidium protococcarum]|nr:hypothetical protein MP228_006943 [Amoeboaphelidium protococcarum]